MLRYIVILLVWIQTEIACSRVRIEHNAYKGILIALPDNIKEVERSRLLQNAEQMLTSSSVILQMATKGRAYFSQVSFLLPDTWNTLGDEQMWKPITFLNSSTLSGPRAALTVNEADVVITEKGQYPYVLHQGGCGRRAMRIILPKDFLLRFEDKGVEFARLWSEYRYGVFPEGGFQNDEKHPATYRTANGGENKITGCTDNTTWSSDLCHKDDKQCIANSMTSSLMDQHLSSSALLFCEGSVSLGPRHNTESPSKHNLLCKEEGTWFTVVRNQDFAHGKNAAPKYLQRATEVNFRFVRKAVSPKIIVAIELSTRMIAEQRYLLTQAAFYHFVYSALPYGSEITLFVFGDGEGTKLVKEKTVLKSEDSRILYVESQPFPEEALNAENVSLSHIFHDLFLANDDTNEIEAPSSTIIVVTAESYINASTYSKVKKKLFETESQLYVMLFAEDEKGTNGDEPSPALQNLCTETGGEFISLQNDPLGDLYMGFGKSIRSLNKEIQIIQDYLKEDTDVDLEVSFVVDDSLTENLKVYLLFPYSETNHLQFEKTVLLTPSGSLINFMKLEFLFAWVVDLTEPEVGEYVLKTKRVEGITDPILVSVTGRPSMDDDPITVNVWAENLIGSQVIPHPVQIFAEVKKGWDPVRDAYVVATVRHPDGKTSELVLLDDGIGDVDITKDDGIYGRYFTSFTAPGSYNVYVKVTHGTNNTSEVMKGPDGFCCGSSFTAVTNQPTGRFQRQGGPFTFSVPKFEDKPMEDRYPPARITDLRLSSMYDRICVLHWTAVGDDFDLGSAKSYELKVFRDTAIIRRRFSNSGQEMYSEMIESAAEATYGTTLNHAFELPFGMRGGTYYAALRAIDDVGNAGEPSNAVPLWIEEASSAVIDCESEVMDCENDICNGVPLAERLQGNSGQNIFSGAMTLIFILPNIFVSVLSLPTF